MHAYVIRVKITPKAMDLKSSVLLCVSMPAAAPWVWLSVLMSVKGNLSLQGSVLHPPKQMGGMVLNSLAQEDFHTQP